MTIPGTSTTSSPLGTKHETVRQWLQRRFRKELSTRPISQSRVNEEAPAQRPRTAPSSGTNVVPTMPPPPIDIRPSLLDSPVQPPPRPPRPDSGTMRNVNAWLDTSVTTPSPPLMGGLPYWRKAIVTNAKDTVGMQHARPIVREPAIDRRLTAHSGLTKSFRRRAKRVEVQMPVSAHGRPNGNRSRKQVNRRSKSMPAFAIPFNIARQEPMPIPLVSPSMRLDPARARSHINGTMSGDGLASGRLYLQDSLRSSRSSGMDGGTEQYRQAIFGMSTRSVDSTRPSTAAARIAREDSMGDISDVPSYFSGLPPPSYRSRPASILTTSSFGCIDGMNPAQRQISQQRAAAQRGVRGKLKRLAQSFTSST